MTPVPPVWREATRADVAAVVALLADDVFGRGREGTDLTPYLAAFDAMQREGDNRLIVAEAEGRVVACYQITLISGLSLSAARRAADRRGRGLGAALIADAEARARAGGATLLQFTTNAARTDAQRFYQRLGFTPSHIGFKKTL